MKTHYFKQSIVAMYLAVVVGVTPSYVIASPAAEEHGEHLEISAEIAAKAGIVTHAATAGDIDKTVTVYGKIVADSGRISHIRARFPGTITTVKASLGQRVKKDQLLARVESNQSLKTYSLRAPFDGVITARHATPGELSEQQALFTVSNFDQVWAEFQVFPSQVRRVAIGQRVLVSIEDNVSESQLIHLVPSDTGLPFVLARVPLDNSNGQWTPGLLVQGNVSVLTMPVAVQVANRALQRYENNNVVFVKEGDKYEVRPVKTGRSDDRITEIIEGLQIGEQYVIDNSYVLKADLEKSGASHAH